jgi:uncharacterized protein (DUF1697 family)
MTYIAFLRAINVGGHTVRMDVLRARFEEMGFTSVKTFIASGNVIFDTAKRDTGKMERAIEKHLRESLGYDVDTFLRSPAEVASVAALEASLLSGARTGHSLYVGFLHDALSAEQQTILQSFRTSSDEFHVSGREVFWTIAGNFSDSKFSNAVLEKKLGVRATFRNITTVSKLAGLYS